MTMTGPGDDRLLFLTDGAFSPGTWSASAGFQGSGLSKQSKGPVRIKLNLPENANVTTRHVMQGRYCIGPLLSYPDVSSWDKVYAGDVCCP